MHQPNPVRPTKPSLTNQTLVGATKHQLDQPNISWTNQTPVGPTKHQFDQPNTSWTNQTPVGPTKQ